MSTTQAIPAQDTEAPSFALAPRAPHASGAFDIREGRFLFKLLTVAESEEWQRGDVLVCDTTEAIMPGDMVLASTPDHGINIWRADVAGLEDATPYLFPAIPVPADQLSPVPASTATWLAPIVERRRRYHN